jgi:hypothetical protein
MIHVSLKIRVVTVVPTKFVLTCSAVVERAGYRSADLGEGGWTQVARRQRRVSTTQQQQQEQEQQEEEEEEKEEHCKEPEERRERRLLLIYLHDETLPSSRSFCSQVYLISKRVERLEN